MPLAGIQSIVHSISTLLRVLLHCNKKDPKLVSSGSRTGGCAGPIRAAPIVSSTSSTVDSAQGSNALGFFLAAHGRARTPPRMMRRRNRQPLGDTTRHGESPRKPAPKKAPSTRKPALAGYLQKILTARVYDVAIESALDPAPRLSARLGNQVLFKREDTQPVFSFKLRGAYNKMAHLSKEALARGVICASAGNHAQGVALAARELGCKALVVMPTTTPSLKVAAVRALGAEVVLRGDSYSDAYAHALELEAKRGLTFVHPFDDPDVIAGQGTIAMEILRQHQGPIDAIFVAIGGGGLVSGIAAYVKAVRPGSASSACR
jgi:hypothetical protein